MNAADLLARVKKHPVGFGCLLVCLLCGGWLYYRSGELEKRQQEFEAKAAEAAVISSNVAVSKNLPEQVAEMQALAKELDGRLVRAGQLALNQQYFYRLEAETEVKLLDVRQNALNRAAKTGYVGIPFAVNVQGSYKQVMNFLQRLEKGRHFCRVLSATFVKSSGGEYGQDGITMSLNIELFGQP